MVLDGPVRRHSSHPPPLRLLPLSARLHISSLRTPHCSSSSYSSYFLELITGKFSVDPELGDKDLVKWVSCRMEQKGVGDVIDPRLKLCSLEEEVYKVLDEVLTGLRRRRRRGTWPVGVLRHWACGEERSSTAIAQGRRRREEGEGI